MEINVDDYPEIFAPKLDLKKMPRRSRHRRIPPARLVRSHLWVARYAKRMTQAELAVQAQVSRKTISDIEQSKIIPNVLVALRIADVLQVPIERIFRLVKPK